MRYVNFKWGLTGEHQCMEVENGRVVSRTPLQSYELESASRSGVVDLGGRFLLPSFIDAHCHILPTGLDLKRLYLGNATSRDEVLQLVRENHVDKPDGWLQAVHYNQTKFEDGEHLTRHDLDKISSTRPILLEHVNGHATVANSAALAAAGVTDATTDPAGGHYRRDALGHIDGVLLERAHEYVTGCAPKPSVNEMAEAIVAAGEKMAELGISCASDMMTGYCDLERELMAYARAAEMGCQIHMRLYLQYGCVFGRRAMPSERLKDLFDELHSLKTVRVDGIKIFADGGISSATAAIYGKFLTTERPHSNAPLDEIETDGQLIYKPEKLNTMVRTVHESGYKVSIHSIGDYSTDLVMDALALTDMPSRHRIEHAMLLSDAQIERMKKLDCYCTFQPEFLLRLGTAYRRQLGETRSSKLIRSRSVIDAGIRLSFNSDRPIVAGDPWDGILTASDRPCGYDPMENCTRQEAIMAYTVEAADVNGDKTEMGSLLPCMLAHFQLYDSDPITTARPIPIPMK